MTTQIFVASTAFGLASIAAALDDGLYEPARRRILVTANNAAIPEVSPDIAEVVGMPALLARFDDVFSYNEVIRPQHPAVWRPRAADLTIWHRHLQLCWQLDDAPVQLVVESIQTPPALVLAQTFADARIDVYGDGLMSYGPTRNALPSTVAARIERLVHLDLVPGVEPLLLSEFGVPAVRIADHAFLKIIDGLDAGPCIPDAGPVAVLLGQYLSVAGLLSADEERELHADMVRGAVTAGFERLVFKPHPSAPEIGSRELESLAAGLGAKLRVHTDPALVESWFGDDRVGLVIGCFSTALLTAASLYRLPVARVGTSLVLRRLKPYENSNRIPAVIVDAAVPDLAESAAENAAPSALSGQLDSLVRTVGYCMQPERYPSLRAHAVTQLEQRIGRAYVSRRRLTVLGLPGQCPARPRRSRLRRAARRALGPQTYNALGALLRRGRQLVGIRR